MVVQADGTREIDARLASRRSVLKAGGWLAAAVALLGARSSLVDARPLSAQAEPLEGSWKTEAAREGEPPAVGLFTYMAGGTVISTNNDPLLGPAHGVWIRVGEREYDYVFERSRWDSDRNYLGIRRVQARINVAEGLDTHALSGVATDLDVSGNVVATRQTSARATRIKLEASY